MDTFWKWLMRANARALFGCALIVLALTTGWWTWREFQPVDSLAPVSPGVLQERAHMPLGILALLQRQIEEGTHVPDNLFLISAGPRIVVPVKQPVHSVKKPIAPVTIKAPKQPPPPPPPPPPKPRETVNLTYHGLFTRPDGRTVALIEDSKSNARKFYQPGDTLFGMTVGPMNFAAMELTDTDSDPVSLPLGQPRTFEDGRHAP